MLLEASLPKQMNPLMFKYEYTTLDVILKGTKVGKNQCAIDGFLQGEEKELKTNIHILIQTKKISGSDFIFLL